MKKYSVLKSNWFGFDHQKVNEKFEGNLSFLNSFCVYDEYKPVAVYLAKNPNLKKGHKKYMLLTNKLIRGMDEKEMKKWKFQDAILCKKCNTVIYSVNRHHYVGCICESVYIDGGRDYTKVAFNKDSNYTTGRLNLLTDKFTPTKNKLSRG